MLGHHKFMLTNNANKVLHKQPFRKVLFISYCHHIHFWTGNLRQANLIEREMNDIFDINNIYLLNNLMRRL